MIKVIEEKLKDKFEIDSKRFYLPFKYEKKCTCGEMLEYNLNDQYLSYPTINEVIYDYIYCDNCGKEHPVDVQIEITVVVRDSNVLEDNK